MASERAFDFWQVWAFVESGGDLDDLELVGNYRTQSEALKALAVIESKPKEYRYPSMKGAYFTPQL